MIEIALINLTSENQLNISMIHDHEVSGVKIYFITFLLYKKWII